MAWRLAKSLIKLRDQINVAAPNRSKMSDGSIGDTRHVAIVSDHNPDSLGRVTAIDITHDPSNGVNGHVLARLLTLDSRVKYVIFAGFIWKARTGRWETYTGPNPHNTHVHVSVKQESADNETPWKVELHPVYGNPVEFVKAFQRKFGLKVDGVPGKDTWGALGSLSI